MDTVYIFLQHYWWFIISLLGALLLTAGYNHTAYYPSLTDLQSSLTIYNSSSSRFTLYVMAIVSILVPFVAGYIWYVWRAMGRKRISEQELQEEGDHLY